MESYRLEDFALKVSTLDWHESVEEKVVSRSPEMQSLSKIIHGPSGGPGWARLAPASSTKALENLQVVSAA